MLNNSDENRVQDIDDRIERFLAKRVASEWFTVLGWVTITGAVQYLRRDSGSLILGAVVAISYILLVFYLQDVVRRIDFRYIPVQWPQWSRRLTALVISLFSSLALFTLMNVTVKEASRKQESLESSGHLEEGGVSEISERSEHSKESCLSLIHI